jgi:hypothetical protein
MLLFSRLRNVTVATACALALLFSGHSIEAQTTNVPSASVAVAAVNIAGAPSPQPCPEVQARDEQQRNWSACERFVWSCLIAGREANLFARECAEPRTPRNGELRRAMRYAPFIAPERFKDTNLIGSRFLHTILSRKELSDQIPPTGVRIFGAYFAEPLNLENIATEKNVVIDGSIFSGDVRMTNFSTRYNLSFDGSNVRGRILLLRARIDGSLFIQNGVYDHIDLRDARVGASIDAADSIYNGLFRLDRAQVAGKLEFERSKITDWSAVDASVGGVVRFYLADVRSRLDLTGIRIAGDLRMQKMRFGRWRGGDGHLCDWNLEADPKSFFSPANPDLAADPAGAKRMLQEIAASRPFGNLPDVSPSYVCARGLKSELHEVLLREMKVGGTLCLIDATGEIETKGGEPLPRLSGGEEFAGRPSVETISLDGSETRATVIRWAESQSRTLWRAVNYSTGYMLIDLDSQPQRHFIDNLEMKSIAFVSSKHNAVYAAGRPEDSDKLLCDITPDPKTAVPSETRLAHDRMIAFFTDDARNQSRSAQPLAKIVERLANSGAASTHLKMALSEYKFRRLCSTSEYFKERNREPTAGWWHSWRQITTRPELASLGQRIDESRKIGLDLACSLGIGSDTSAVSYGHEPHNIIFIIIMFVLGSWGLLSLDHRVDDDLDGRPPKLGLMYAIDMFNPFPQVLLNRQHAKWKPVRPSLQLYMRFHRLIGFILCIILAISIYSGGK